ncbi:PLDc N-terminal domain-containing protein [Pontibacter locisalis]|uniref:PLDc N-terminal domain-containing protein n=1 Tax=Pontibacter locisalis TaxID=1719035 RepID=A0ABW5IJD4_9BACT
MELVAKFPLAVVLIVANYLLVVYSVFHLIFKTHYTLAQRLNWVVVLWIVPLLGPMAYWYFWRRRDR